MSITSLSGADSCINGSKSIEIDTIKNPNSNDDINVITSI